MRYRLQPGSFRVDIAYLTVRMSAEVDTVPADPISDLPVTNTVDWGSFIHRYYRIFKPDGRIARAANTIVTNNGADVVPLSGVRNGDPGVRGRESRILIEAGDEVVIYDQRVPNTGWSRIDGSDFLKKWDVPFDVADPQTQYPAPCPNCGVDQAASADPTTGYARLTFTVNPKFWSGSGDVLWNLATGMVLVGGYALTDLTIEVDVPPGQHEITVVCTDTGFANEPISRGFRNVYVRGEGFQAFSDIVRITAIESDMAERIGRSCILVVEVDRNTDISDYLYEGATVLLTYKVQQSSGGNAWEDQADAINVFKGYLAKIETGREVGGIVTYRLHIESPLIYFRLFGIASQLLQVVNPPANWLEVHPDFSHLAFVLYYILEYNAPSLLQYVDIDFGEFESYFFPEFSFRSDTLTGTALSAVGLRPLANVGCKSDGTIVLRDHLCILDTADRTALGSRYTWTARKIFRRIGYDRNFVPRYNRMLGYCFLIDGVTTGAFQANLLAPGFGSDDGTMPDFLALDLTEAAWIVARYLAFMARPTETVEWSPNGMIDQTDPAEMQPHTMAVATYDPGATGIFSNRVLPLSVSRTWKMTQTIDGKEAFNPTFDISITAEPETDAPAQAPEFEDPELGSIEGYYEIIEFDFETGTHGWELEDPSTGVYVAGQGFKTIVSGAFMLVRIRPTTLPLNAESVTDVLMCYERLGTDTLSSSSVGIGTDDEDFALTTVEDAAGTYTVAGSGSWVMSADNLLASLVMQPNSVTEAIIRKIALKLGGSKSSYWTDEGEVVSVLPEC